MYVLVSLARSQNLLNIIIYHILVNKYWTCRGNYLKYIMSHCETYMRIMCILYPLTKNNIPMVMKSSKVIVLISLKWKSVL